jgi:hypothetical protein
LARLFLGQFGINLKALLADELCHLEARHVGWCRDDELATPIYRELEQLPPLTATHFELHLLHLETFDGRSVHGREAHFPTNLR